MDKLTKTQEKILQVMTDPTNWGTSQTQIAELANCSRNSVYLAVKDTDFIKRYNDITMNILGSRTADIINASIRQAMTPEGFNDRKMLLTMTGLYSDKTQIAAKVENKSSEILESILAQMTEPNDGALLE